MNIRLNILLTVLLTAVLWVPSHAQTRPGERTVVRGGMIIKPDTLRAKRDSLALAAMFRELDSVTMAGYAADSAALTALRTDDIRTTDSLMRISMLAEASLDKDKKDKATDTVKVYKKGWLMNDSMSLSKVCWISTVLPGYGQVYNKQYWKLPVLYGLLGTGLGLYIHENKTYRPLKREFEAYTDASTNRTPELDALQTRLIRSNTRRQLYLGVTVASYIYFLGDVAVNYSTNKVSDVKKATTLACICPGAGQIYNKAYWKVPFVVGGFAAMIYCIDWNNRGYQRFKKAYALRQEYENNKDDKDKYPNGSPDEFNGRYSPTFLKNQRDANRRNRDLCIIVSAALYVLQIIDAHVDAHLKDYDVSEDLSMNIEPYVNYAYVPTLNNSRPIFGFNLSLKF